MDKTHIVLHKLDTVDSTNLYGKLHAEKLADGTLITARAQTAGRGRLGRIWVSPPDENFYGSLLLKSLDNPFLGTIIIALSALDALAELVPALPVWLKWPNDLYVGGAKLAGVLSEAFDLPDGRRAIIAGIGVNLNAAPEEMAAIGRPAASVFSASGIQINPEKFALKLAEKANTCYIKGLHCSDGLFDEWRKRNAIVGFPVELDLGGGHIECGIAEEIASDGALVMRRADGTLKRCYSGDASVTREGVAALAERLASGNKENF